MAKYIYPTSTKKLSQGFGANPSFYAKYGQKGHNGWDFPVPSGTPVHAVADGVVAFEGWGQNHGWAGSIAGIYCLIKHASNYSGYAHLQRTIVNRGQTVKQGQVIGYSDSTGVVTGAHLHFEMYPLSVNTANGYYGRTDPGPLLNPPAPKPPAPKPKIATVVGAVANVRSGPHVSSPLAGSKQLKKGQTFEYVSIVKGDKVSGNSNWYKSKLGHYVWAGNLKG